MKTTALNSIDKLYFGYETVARALDISPASARVSAARYAAQGLLLRVKRNTYVLREKWNAAGTEDKFILANLGQVPSYVSLMTALEYHGITTQVQRDYIESVAVKRTREMHVSETVFRYTRVKNDLYFGFKREKGFFVATPEKAFLDSMYLVSLGRYALDLSAVDTERLDRKEFKRLCKKFPSQTLTVLEKHGYL
jgi:predicted transcriptional regulator of viral defense system